MEYSELEELRRLTGSSETQLTSAAVQLLFMVYSELEELRRLADSSETQLSSAAV
jgi:hypothetical protein